MQRERTQFVAFNQQVAADLQPKLDADFAALLSQDIQPIDARQTHEVEELPVCPFCGYRH